MKNISFHLMETKPSLEAEISLVKLSLEKKEASIEPPLEEEEASVESPLEGEKEASVESSREKEKASVESSHTGEEASVESLLPFQLKEKNKRIFQDIDKHNEAINIITSALRKNGGNQF